MNTRKMENQQKKDDNQVITGREKTTRLGTNVAYCVADDMDCD